jgi:hypothetical protein
MAETLTEFNKDFIASFTYKDKKEDLIRNIKSLKQGNQTAKKMINKFWLLVSKGCWNKHGNP